LQKEKIELKKLPKPVTSRYNSWEEFVKKVQKSIGRQLGSGVISFNNEYQNK
jgi:hypothetical protein